MVVHSQIKYKSEEIVGRRLMLTFKRLSEKKRAHMFYLVLLAERHQSPEKMEMEGLKGRQKQGLTRRRKTNKYTSDTKL